MIESTQSPSEPAVARALSRLRERRDLQSDQINLRDPGPDPSVASELVALYRTDPFDGDALAERLHLHRARGLLREITFHEWMFKLEAHPRSRRWDEAERHLVEMERIAQDLDGQSREQALSAVDRHRGWVAFQQRDCVTALQQNVSAYERDPHVANLQNILCILVRMGEMSLARGLLADAERLLPAPELRSLQTLCAADPDLAALTP